MTDAVIQFGATCATKGISIVPSWYKYIDGKTVDGRCELQFTFPNDIVGILLALVEILLRVGAIVAVGFVIYGGFLYMTSRGEMQGNVEKTAIARSTITNALVGLAITLFATGIVSFIGGQLT